MGSRRSLSIPTLAPSTGKPDSEDSFEKYMMTLSPKSRAQYRRNNPQRLSSHGIITNEYVPLDTLAEASPISAVSKAVIRLDNILLPLEDGSRKSVAAIDTSWKPKRKLTIKKDRILSRLFKMGRNLIQLAKSTMGGRTVKAVTPAASMFELTPLSNLIEQSYHDVEILKMIGAVQKTGLGGNRVVLIGRVELADKDCRMVDFEKFKSNIRQFQGVYQEFLKSGGEEVHLVAKIAKRSEVTGLSI